MDAGAGAQDQARRHEERVVAMEAERAALEARLESARRQQHTWTAGAVGERRVGACLEALGPGWRVLHDVRWPGRQRANLDHVAVGPTGVWVVDAKNWSGDVSFRDGVLRCSGYRKIKETEALAAGAAAVAALLQPSHRLLVRPVLCLAGAGVGLDQQRTPVGTRVVGLSGLAGSLTSTPVCLQPGEVDWIADHLQAQLGGETTPPVVTTARIPAQASSVREPSFRTPPRGSRETPRARAPRPSRSSPVRARGNGRRRTRSAGRELLGSLLKLVVFLLIAYVGVQTIPTWSPVLQEYISQLFLQPMLDNVTEQTATTAPVP